MADAPVMTRSAFGAELGVRTHIMGVLNVTPDSFSDGGRYGSVAAAVAAAQTMVEEGADVIDIGGESTRPGAPAVSAEAELARVIPVIEALASAGVGQTTISIDTTKAEVAEAAVGVGAGLVNDISAMTFDPAMAATVARLDVPVVLSHTRDRPEVMQKGDLRYEGGVVAAVRSALAAALEDAKAAGVAMDRVIVDPGIGFGKTVEDNLRLLRDLEPLRSLGCPVLVGTSRKSFLGRITGRPVEQRLTATVASVALAVAAGADIVRVHDVAAARDAVRVADALVRGWTS